MRNTFWMPVARGMASSAPQREHVSGRARSAPQWGQYGLWAAALPQAMQWGRPASPTVGAPAGALARAGLRVRRRALVEGEEEGVGLLDLPREEDRVGRKAEVNRAARFSLLGLLADHQELTAMQAAGMSVQRIAFSVLGTSVVLMLAAVILAEFIAPPLDQSARFMRSRAVYGKAVIMQKEGFWVRHGQSFVYVGRTFGGGGAADIEIYELDESGRLRRFIAAKQASVQDGQDWLLTDIQAKVFDGESVSVSPMDHYRLTSFLTPVQVSILELPADSLSLSDLWGFIRSLNQRSENSKAYALAFWQKVCLPVTTGIMVLLSLTFVCSKSPKKNTRFRPSRILGTHTGPPATSCMGGPTWSP